MTHPRHTPVDFWGRILSDSTQQAKTQWMSETNRWKDEVREALAELEPGQQLILLTEGLRPREAGRALIRIVVRRMGPPPVTEVASAVRSHGGQVDAVYFLWPTTSAARIASPRDHPECVAWAARVGLLGGGSRLWLRWLLRRRPISFLIPLLFTSSVLVCSSPTSDE